MLAVVLLAVAAADCIRLGCKYNDGEFTMRGGLDNRSVSLCNDQHETTFQNFLSNRLSIRSALSVHIHDLWLQHPSIMLPGILTADL